MRSSTIWDYSQPQFYKFDEVTIWFAHLVAAQLDPNRELFGIDICAGCGVIGIEIMLRLPTLRMDFCDDLITYDIHIKENLTKASLIGRASKIFIADCSQLKLDYDLIVMNPPFFLEGNHRLSPDVNRNHARLLQNDFFKTFFSLINLTKKTEIFILFPKDQRSLIEKEASNFALKQLGINGRYEALRLLHLNVDRN